MHKLFAAVMLGILCSAGWGCNTVHRNEVPRMTFDVENALLHQALAYLQEKTDKLLPPEKRLVFLVKICPSSPRTVMEVKQLCDQLPKDGLNADTPTWGFLGEARFLISFSLKNATLTEILDEICAQTHLKYEWTGNRIKIYDPELSMFDPWVYDGKFHKLIATADRIVIRDGGMDCCESVEDKKRFVELTDPKQIAAFNQHLVFEYDKGMMCACCGYPGIDWYRGNKRLALTAVHHGYTLAWRGFPCGDMGFTKESSKWLASWLLDHKVPDPNGEMRKIIEDKK
jgi:hypothetical protein